jgi:hypothetical protein
MDSTINTEKPYELMTLHELFAVKVQMHKVASSQIDEIGYDPDSKVLAVKFMKGGEFRYVRVHEPVFRLAAIGVYRLNLCENYPPVLLRKQAASNRPVIFRVTHKEKIMKQQYIETEFRQSSLNLIETMNGIIREYKRRIRRSTRFGNPKR